MENACSVSTTWERRSVKIRQRRRPPRGASPEASARRSLAPWRRREPLTIQIVYRGGSEAWYRIKARGAVWYVPGHESLEDVMSSIYNDV